MMPKTLLLADDSVTIQKVVGISFANEDIRIVTVDNGDDAVLRAREIRPDIVLADVVMPGKSGYDVCAALKADPTLAGIPVLLLTGTFETFDEARAARVGVFVPDHPPEVKVSSRQEERWARAASRLPSSRPRKQLDLA
jgi:CheY-like chemotaxis protein